VYASSSLDQIAHPIATRFTRAYHFLHQTLGTSPQVGLLVLSREDWLRYAALPVYGLTHYDLAQRMVIAGGQPSTFWHPVLEMLSETSAQLLQELHQIYEQPDGQIDLTTHIDLWIAHDLGHAFHLQRSYWFPRRWLMELFADLCLYTYVATEEPNHLSALETFPRVMTEMQAGALNVQVLQDFETRYLDMPLETYLWYHGHFFEQAKQIYTAVGVSALQNMWHLFVASNVQDIPDEDIIAMLKRIQPNIEVILVN
jgi:hypothetical protein